MSSYLDVLFPRILNFYGVNSSILDIWSGSAELPVNSYCCVFRNWDKMRVSECDDDGIGLLHQAWCYAGGLHCLYHHAATAAVYSRLNLRCSARGRHTSIGIAQSSRRACGLRLLLYLRYILMLCVMLMRSLLEAPCVGSLGVAPLDFDDVRRFRQQFAVLFYIPL